MLQVHATYFQGKWVGHLASDYIQFPSLPSVPEVRSDIALITKSHKFFMNRSGWQVNLHKIIFIVKHIIK